MIDRRCQDRRALGAGDLELDAAGRPLTLALAGAGPRSPGSALTSCWKASASKPTWVRSASDAGPSESVTDT